MLSVILLILKIIGIAIAVLLGFVLSVVLLILFVPIRYKVQAKRESEIEARARVSWLFHIVNFRISYIGKENKYCLRIFGYPVLSDKPKKRKKKKKNTKNKQKQRKQGASTSSKPAVRKRTPAVVITDQKMNEELKALELDSKPERDLKQEQAEKTKQDVKKEQAVKRKKTVRKKKQSGFERFKEKIKQFFEKLSNGRTWIRGIKQKIRDMLSMVKKILKKIDVVKKYIFDKNNRPGFLRCIDTIRKLLKYLHPKKLIMNVYFGTGDPATTGQILGGICAIYPQILGSVNLRPNFEEKVFEADLFAKGKVRIIRLLIMSIQLIIDHEFKHVLHELKELKEEL